MDKEEKSLRQLLKENGYNLDNLFTSGVANSEETKEQLVGILSDIIKNQTNNSSKINKVEGKIDGADFYLGIISDAHSKLYLLENYLSQLNTLGGKCVVTGDISNGSNHFKGHDNSLKESLNLTNDVISIADIMKRYPEMFIGYVEGNHDQWISEGTSLLLGHLACKIAGVDSIYAKNVQLITQNTKINGKDIPFNFLIVHGEGMPSNIINALKNALSTACSKNVDAIIFGHTHKMGSASTTILKRIANGTWQERQVTAYNPGSILETSDYADKANYPPLTPFDGTVLHCSVVKGKSGEYKKCIDLENVMNIINKNDNSVLNSLENTLNRLESKKFKTKQDIKDSYIKIYEQFLSKKCDFDKPQNGQYLVSLSGISDMYCPDTPQEIRKKIKKDLSYIVSVIQEIPNISIVLNGDLIYDYNKGYIEKKDYCSDTIAALQDLCEILAPVSNKICAINNGKMEESIMKVERDKGNGRIGSGKRKLKELANYASQILQLDEKLAYAPYDKQKMYEAQLAIQNDSVNQANQKVLDKAYENFKKAITQKPEIYEQIFKDEKNIPKSPALFEKKVKEFLLDKLRREHKVLDISNPEDKKIIDKRYPLSEIDLRMPNENLIGNIICKMLNLPIKTTKVNSIINSMSSFNIYSSDGKNKTISTCYCTSLSKFMRELPSRLNNMGEPPDVVLLNNYVTKSGTDLQEFTTQIRISYFNANGEKKIKDVLIIDSGSFAYSKYLTNGKIPTNLIYKIIDVDPIFKTLIPKNSINYMDPESKRPAIEKFNYESIKNQNNQQLDKTIREKIKKSAIKCLNNFDKLKYLKENDKLGKIISEQLDEIFEWSEE